MSQFAQCHLYQAQVALWSVRFSQKAVVSDNAPDSRLMHREEHFPRTMMYQIRHSGQAAVDAA